jgi:large conductance mechanosensitive channel
MLKEFREFAVKGNLIEIAVGLILALAFSAVVMTFVDGVVMPLIAAAVGEPNFDAIIWTVGESEILIGTFLTAVVNFLLIAWGLFMIVRAANRMQRDAEAEPETPSDEIVLLTEIRDTLRQRLS